MPGQCDVWEKRNSKVRRCKNASDVQFVYKGAIFYICDFHTAMEIQDTGALFEIAYQKREEEDRKYAGKSEGAQPRRRRVERGEGQPGADPAPSKCGSSGATPGAMTSDVEEKRGGPT